MNDELAFLAPFSSAPNMVVIKLCSPLFFYKIILFALQEPQSEQHHLSVGTEVSAKYRGAFCEARIKGVKKTVVFRVSIAAAINLMYTLLAFYLIVETTFVFIKPFKITTSVLFMSVK